MSAVSTYLDKSLLGELTLAEVQAEQEQVPVRLRMKCYSDRQVKEPSYRDLRGVTLSPEEKTWLCQEVGCKNVARYNMCRSKKGLIRRYGLYKNFFTKNWKSYIKHGSTMSKGAPPIGSAPGERNRILTLLTKRRNEVDEMTYHELTDELSSIKKARKESANIFVPAEKLDRKVDSRTTAAFVKRNNLQLGNKQPIDKSRVAACSCPLISYVWYIICLAISGYLPPCCKWNADACTFVFHSKHSHKTVRLLHENEYEFLVDGEVQLNDTQKGKSKSTNSKLPYGIKVRNEDVIIIRNEQTLTYKHGNIQYNR